MSHAWGGLPDDASDYDEVGSNVSLLISNERDFEPINAMARQSGIPVNIVPAPVKRTGEAGAKRDRTMPLAEGTPISG
jgi:hypothetical protein